MHDIANFVVKHTLQSSEIFNCLKLTWIPDPKYDFPIRTEGKHNRKFQYKYLEIFPWLAYSEINKGAYCKWCVVFAFSGGGSGNQVYYTEKKLFPLIIYKYSNFIIISCSR